MAIPENIRVDVDTLDLNQFLHARDIAAPEGVKILEDPESIIVAVHVPKVAAEAEVPGAEAISEPEVIGEKKKEEEEEEEK